MRLINKYPILRYKTNIPMKISIKPFKDFYPKYGELNINIIEFKKKYKNICYVIKKCIHHDHSKKRKYY